MHPERSALHPSPASLGASLTGLGVDLVQVSAVARSLADFGPRFLKRLYTEQEVADANRVPALRHRRLAERFAAKEAAIKALGLTDAGINWRELEVVLTAGGACRLRLHGRASALCAGLTSASLSLSQQGDYAVALVAVSSAVKNS